MDEMRDCQTENIFPVLFMNGFEFFTHRKIPFCVMLRPYEQGNILIVYSRYLIHNYKNQIAYENAEARDLSIAGRAGIIIEQIVGTQFVRTLIWNDEEYTYTLSGNIPEETFVSAAERVQKIIKLSEISKEKVRFTLFHR